MSLLFLISFRPFLTRQDGERIPWSNSDELDGITDAVTVPAECLEAVRVWMGKYS